MQDYVQTQSNRNPNILVFSINSYAENARAEKIL